MMGLAAFMGLLGRRLLIPIVVDCPSINRRFRRRRHTTSEGSQAVLRYMASGSPNYRQQDVKQPHLGG